MVGEAGENRLWGRERNRAATAQDQLDRDRRNQSDAEGQKKIKIAPLHCRAVPVRFRRDPITIGAPAMAGALGAGSMRRLRCDRNRRHGKRLSIETAAAGAGSTGTAAFSASAAPAGGNSGIGAATSVSAAPAGRAVLGRAITQHGISGRGAGSAVAEAAGFCAGSTGAADGSTGVERQQAGSTARLPVSAWGRAERPGSAATGTGVPAGSARSWRAGPMPASRQRPAQRRAFACEGAGSRGVTAGIGATAAAPDLTRGMAPARRRQPASAPDRAAAGSCMRADPRRRPSRHSRMRPPCRRHAGRFWRRIRARTGFPRMSSANSNRAGVVQENCGKTSCRSGGVQPECPTCANSSEWMKRRVIAARRAIGVGRRMDSMRRQRRPNRTPRGEPSAGQRQQTTAA